LHILDYLGNQLHVLNLPAPRGDDWNGGLGAPTIANIDGDADMELIIGTVASGVVAYDLPGTANARILWGTGRGSYKRTGVAAAEEGLSLSANPSNRAIDSGNVTTYTLTLQGSSEFTASVTLNVTNPSPTYLNLNLSSSNITLPDQVILTITDQHSGPLVPGVWYNIPVIATGGGITRTTTVNLLVGGTRTHLPIILK